MSLYQHLEVAQFTLDVKIMNPCARRGQKRGVVRMPEEERVREKRGTKEGRNEERDAEGEGERRREEETDEG